MNSIPITRRLIENAAAIAAAMFVKDGMLQPLWHIVRSDGENGVIASPFDDGEDKDVVAAAMRKMFEELDVVAYVFMCESWMLRTAEIDVKPILREGIRNHPQRVECLWYGAEDIAGAAISACQIIERPEGQPARVLPLEWLETAVRMEGRFIGMLPVKGKAH